MTETTCGNSPPTEGLQTDIPTTTAEIEVLIATSIWLSHREPKPTIWRFSLAHGQGINSEVDQSTLKSALDKEGIGGDLILSGGHGPDVTTISSSEFWKIECKGTGIGKKSTQRNNFDRALASVVSYYNAMPTTSAESVDVPREFLGLALPNSRDYRNELERRVRRPLRRALNLWVLLYEPTGRTIRAVSPEQDY